MDAIKVLLNLEELDLSNNRLKTMPDTSFHFLRRLKILELQDNIIETVHKGTFQVNFSHEVSNYLLLLMIKIYYRNAFMIISGRYPLIFRTNLSIF